MGNPTDNSAQGHLTLTFPMKSPADCAAARKKIPTLVPDLYRAADAMGNLHYCRLIALDEMTLVLLADFDGTLDTVIADISKHFGPFLDAMFEHVKQGPPRPVADNAKAFLK